MKSSDYSAEPFTERVPTYDELNWPALLALRGLGGSASIAEHLSQVITDYGVPEDVASIPHGKTGRSEIEYRLAWARTALRRCGYVENSSRGVWSLTEDGEHATESELKIRISELRAADHSRYLKRGQASSNEPDNGNDPDWKDQLLDVLRKMAPDAFERLAKRLLRESGFVKVAVTGKSGDGGIDGTGILQLSLMSFDVLFQCKRYQGSVGPSDIRDFRGAMMGRTDKGLFITTGTFTSQARAEATRDGAPPIDLIDGVSLCEKLKDLRLGIEIELVEEVSVKEDWFALI